MPIMASTLYRDMLNFFRNQFTDILLLTLLPALVSVILSHTLSPGSEQLIAMSDSTNIGDTANINLQQLIQHMSVEQQIILLKASAAGALSGLIGNVLLAGSLLTMISRISNRQPISVFRAIGLSVPLLPRLLLLIFLITLLVQLGLLLIIIPGILLAIVFSLAPIIAISDNLSALKSMHMSTNIAFANIRLLTPAVLFWLIAKAAILILATKLTVESSIMVSVLLDGFSNLISALLLIYLYRLYMLLKQN